MTRPRRAGLFALALLGILALCVLAPGPAGALTEAPRNVLTAGEAVVLGVVEGITEYLPISSTGHLLVAGRIMDLPTSGAAGDAVKSYDVAIQAGAILAVLLLFRRRIRAMIEGLLGRSAEGRKVLLAVLVAFVPAAVVGVISEKVIKDVLFGTWPVLIAWAVGGVAIIVMSRNGMIAGHSGRPLEAITNRDALMIGAAQVLALWPGTSRSLVTIVAALLLGFSMPAAVEFSFLLGLVTLGAATAYETLTSGKTMLDSLGLGVPVLGVVVAFAAAAASVAWMVGYLKRHDLQVFGWYRIAVAALVVVLLAANVI
ncbi:MAG TPA: undecaprenyl-diphosphate phosphatase [Acidimicrobiales bacterium]|nr:undecaprenyl-diphosphate phosphatase [Acidimicrobiales bacterium]